MDIRKIRRRNLLRMVEEAGGQKRLAERTGVSAAYLCQVLSARVNRNVGHNLARRLEKGMGKPYGWMDVLSRSEWDAIRRDRVREADLEKGYGRGRKHAARYRNLWALIFEAGGMAPLAVSGGIFPPYLEQVAGGGAFHGGFARYLEKLMNKPAGWLDR